MPDYKKKALSLKGKEGSIGILNGGEDLSKLPKIRADSVLASSWLLWKFTQHIYIHEKEDNKALLKKGQQHHLGQFTNLHSRFHHERIWSIKARIPICLTGIPEPLKNILRCQWCKHPGAPA